MNEKFLESEPDEFRQNAADSSFSKRDPSSLRDLKEYNYFIILPDDPFKSKWDIVITA